MSMLFHRPVFRAASFLVCAAAAAAAQGVTLDIPALEASAQEELQATKTPGAAIGIVKDGKLIYSHGFGVFNIETAAPVTPEMLFRLGSITKMLTAKAVATLAAEGKLSFDDAVGKHIHGLDPAIAALTINQVLLSAPRNHGNCASSRALASAAVSCGTGLGGRDAGSRARRARWLRPWALPPRGRSNCDGPSRAVVDDGRSISVFRNGQNDRAYRARRIPKEPLNEGVAELPQHLLARNGPAIEDTADNFADIIMGRSEIWRRDRPSVLVNLPD